MRREDRRGKHLARLADFQATIVRLARSRRLLGRRRATQAALPIGYGPSERTALRQRSFPRGRLLPSLQATPLRLPAIAAPRLPSRASRRQPFPRPADQGPRRPASQRRQFQWRLAWLHRTPERLYRPFLAHRRCAASTATPPAAVEGVLCC